MALLTKDKINQFGVKEEYWRVLEVKINLQYEYCDITLGAYADETARNNNAEPMNIKRVRAKWDDEEFHKYFAPDALNIKAMSKMMNPMTCNTSNGMEVRNGIGSYNIYDAVYEYIKDKDDYFTNALDC